MNLSEAGSAASGEQKYDFFFYGTLCHPAILIRVLRHQGDLLFQDAVLPNYTRHHVRHEDYPAVIHADAARELGYQHDPSKGDENDGPSTRGTVVRGLTLKDVLALDTFEGDQYTRMKLPVRTLSQPAPFSSLPKSLMDPSNRLDALPSDAADHGNSSEVWVYVWSDDVHLLEPKIWDFATFVRDKSAVWTGTSTMEFDDVDRHHAALQQETNGHTDGTTSNGSVGSSEVYSNDQLAGRTKEGFPEFGHSMLEHWGFKKGYLNFNNGSYGSPPLRVVQQMRELSVECESNPDLFMRRTYLPMLTRVRQRVADLIGAETDEVVIVPGATYGMNIILRELDWDEGDVILAYDTTYGAVAQTVKYLADRNPGLSIESIHVDFPCAHSAIIQRTEEALKALNRNADSNHPSAALTKGEGGVKNKRVKALIIDQIASQPGVVFPWEDLVRLCKKYGVLSIVDAAHAIGQVKTDIKLSDPDFWVSNCHKWLYAHRACAALYVPIRNQHLIRSSIPTGHGYESARYPTPGLDREWAFACQFDWTGTQDWAPFLSVDAALDFRLAIGGEERIMAYCHSLAVAGGERLIKRWGDKASVVETEQGELTAAMVNVFLPDAPVPTGAQETFEQRKWYEDRMFASNAFCAVFLHAGKPCARFSCQVWNQLEDFDRMAEILEGAIEGIRRGEHKQLSVDQRELIQQKEDEPSQEV